MKSSTRSGLLILGLLLAAGGALAVIYLPKKDKGNPQPGPTDGPTVPPLKFTDVTDVAGINFHHVSGVTPKKLLPETMGSGVAVIDFDRDGKPDLFFVNSRPWPGQPPADEGRRTQSLYRNTGDGKFEDVTKSAGLDVELYGMGVAVGDYDNDGWPDLFVTAVGGNRLFRNIEGKRFQDVTVAAGFAEPISWPKGSFDEFLTQKGPISFPSSTAFVDYDADGKLDLFVCNYLTWSPALDIGTGAALPGGGRAYVPPQHFVGATAFFIAIRAESLKTFRRALASTFPTAKADLSARRLGVLVSDLDDDGWPDLVVANDTVRNFFFHNVPGDKGGRAFKEDGQFAGLAYADGRPRGGMGIDAGEVLPGDFAIVIVNFSNEPNSLFRRFAPNPPRFSDTAPDVGLAGASRHPMKFGATFLDVDRDGRLDLFVANGHLEPDIAAVQPGQSHQQRGQLFWNSGVNKALLVAAEAEMFPPMVGRGSAYLDYDGDGDLDLVVTDNNGRARLFRNDTETANKSIRLTIAGAGKTNRDAIGALVDVEVAGVVRRWYVSPTRGYLSQSEITPTIGIGSAAKVDRVTVRWPGPGDRTQTWNDLASGGTFQLIENVAEAKSVK